MVVSAGYTPGGVNSWAATASTVAATTRGLAIAAAACLAVAANMLALEVTLRTPAALDAIAEMARVPDTFWYKRQS